MSFPARKLVKMLFTQLPGRLPRSRMLQIVIEICLDTCDFLLMSAGLNALSIQPLTRQVFTMRISQCMIHMSCWLTFGTLGESRFLSASLRAMASTYKIQSLSLFVCCLKLLTLSPTKNKDLLEVTPTPTPYVVCLGAIGDIGVQYLTGLQGILAMDQQCLCSCMGMRPDILKHTRTNSSRLFLGAL